MELTLNSMSNIILIFEPNVKWTVAFLSLLKEVAGAASGKPLSKSV